MRLLHLAPSDPDASGIARYSDRFRRALEDAGVAASVPAWTGAQPHDLSGIRQYVAEARRAVPDADIVHAELGGESLADFYAAREVLRIAEVPLCVTLHDPPLAVWAPFAFSPLSRSRMLSAAARSLTAPVSRVLERGTISRVAEIFVLSASGASALGRRATVLPFPVGDPPPASRIEARDGAFTVAFFGHWYRGKGVELLVRAAAELRREGRGLVLRLWGSPLPSSTGAARYRDRVLAVARELGLGNSVEADALPEAQVASALRSCDVVVLPYERPRRLRNLTSVSSSMVEALAAGTPVVTSEMRGFSDFIRHGDNGLFVRPWDVEGLTDCLRRLHSESALRTRLRAGAVRTAHAMREGKPGTLAAARYQELLARDPRAADPRVGVSHAPGPF
jgi:glycosyltransferase involved in cell wall biosynthesis